MSFSENDAFTITLDYIRHRLRLENRDWVDCPELPKIPSEVCSTLRKLALEFEKKYLLEFEKLFASRLSRIGRGTDHASFHALALGFFEKGEKISWERILKLYAFIGFSAKKCCDRNETYLAIVLAEWLAIFTEFHLNIWIRKRKTGWNGLIEYRKKWVEKKENLKCLRSLIIVFAGVIVLDFI